MDRRAMSRLDVATTVGRGFRIAAKSRSSMPTKDTSCGSFSARSRSANNSPIVAMFETVTTAVGGWGSDNSRSAASCDAVWSNCPGRTSAASWGQPRRVKCRDEPGKAVVAGGKAGDADDHADPALARRDQMLCRQPPRLDIVGLQHVIASASTRMSSSTVGTWISPRSAALCLAFERVGLTISPATRCSCITFSTRLSRRACCPVE